jgi:hypothetical protein
MGERKVLNRYIPPDFDPSIIPKFKREKNKLMDIRMMLPFSLRCNTCGEYMYRGKKFNSKKEDVREEDYMGIKIIRFYIKCSVCSAEITFKTDPKNTDYVCESGASRNFELWRDTKNAMEEENKEREDAEIDPMKSLEHRTLENKQEMDVLDALDEIKAWNDRHLQVSTDKALEFVAKKYQTSNDNNTEPAIDPLTLTAEDEALIKTIQAEKYSKSSISNSNNNNNNNNINPLFNNLQKAINTTTTNNTTTSNQNPILIRKKRKIADTTTTTTDTKSPSLIQQQVEKTETQPISKQPKLDLAATETTTITTTTTIAATASPQQSKAPISEPVNGLNLLLDYGDDDDADQ